VGNLESAHRLDGSYEASFGVTLAGHP
jgi:hypothetical protein